MNACSGPCLMSVTICTVAGCAGRSRPHTEKIEEILDSLVNQRSLMIGREKAGVGLLWVPVFVTDPGHAPVDVRRLGLPKQTQQPCSFTAARKRILKRYRTGVAHSVQCRVERLLLNPPAIRLEQSRAGPATRQTFAQWEEFRS